MPSATATLEVDANGFCAPPLRSPPARRIRDDAEALTVAEEVADELEKRAVERDRDRVLPYEEMELVSDAGLLGLGSRDHLVRGSRTVNTVSPSSRRASAVPP